MCTDADLPEIVTLPTDPPPLLEAGFHDLESLMDAYRSDPNGFADLLPDIIDATSE